MTARVDSSAPAPVGVDVAVCAFRRPRELQRLLDALARQTAPPASIQVVDDSATDKGPAWARNQAWRRGTAPIVAFTDDDCVPAPDWVERIAKAFDDPAVDAVEGRLVGPDSEVLDPPARVRWDRFRTANMAYRRSLLERIGGLDDGYHIHREDTDLAWRALDAGARIVRVPDVVVHHADRPGVARRVPASERRLARLDPVRYAECAAAAVNLASLRSGRLAELYSILAAGEGPGDPPLPWRSRTAIWTRATGIALRWKAGNLLGQGRRQ